MPRPLVKAPLQTQCYGQLITAFPMALLGAGSDSNSKNPPKNTAVSELQPVILNITSVFSCYADSGQLTAYLFCSCLVLFALLAYLWLPFGKNHWEVPHWRAPLGGAGGNHPYHVFSLRLSTKFRSPNTKCENDVSITKAFSQRGWAVIWNKLIFSWEESKSLEVLFF